MDLSTTYLGMKLPHPLMPGASPMVDDLDTVRRLEDAGAVAIVMHSLFEEQIAREQVATFVHTESHGQSNGGPQWRVSGSTAWMRAEGRMAAQDIVRKRL